MCGELIRFMIFWKTLQYTYWMLKWKGPPRVDRTKEVEKIINVDCGMVIWSWIETRVDLL